MADQGFVTDLTLPVAINVQDGITRGLFLAIKRLVVSLTFRVSLSFAIVVITLRVINPMRLIYQQ